MTRPLCFIPILQRRLGAELCAWAVTLWSPGITGWTIRSILTSSRLLSFREQLTSSRVDVHTDNHVLKSALENRGCRSSEVSGVLKDISHSYREHNFSLDVYDVSMGENPAHLPSRSRTGTDFMLSNSAWDQVKRLFGPRTFDLMSLAINCLRNRVGLHLPHFTPCATPESSGINVFAHSLPLNKTIFVLPPFILIAPLLRYLLE